MRIFGCVLVLGAAACLEDKKETSDPVVQTDASALHWYKTCGDPVCGAPNQTPPDASDLCDDEVEGQTCAAESSSCATGDDCGTRLLCTTTDPTQQPGGCPISRAVAKRDIRYIGAEQRARIYGDLLRMPLATYRYRTRPGEERLGFIIDDVGPSYAVLPGGEQVDVYGFAAMAVTAIQEQERRIAELETRLRALENRCL